MAFRTDNRHSFRFRARKMLRRVRDGIDTAIISLSDFEGRNRAAV